MTCDEFERSRAREHLKECGHCRELQTLRELIADEPEVPAKLQGRITREIVGSLRPVSPLPSNRALLTLLLSLAAVACAAGAWWQGHAGWLELAGWQAAIVFCLLAAGMSLAATLIVRQMVPGARRSVPLALALSATCALLFTAVLLIFPYEQDSDFVLNGMHCWEIGLEYSTVAGALFFFVVRRGAWLNPLALGASTGLFAGLVGFTVLEIFCPYLDRAHIDVWHAGSALTATLTGFAIAALCSGMNRILRPAS